MKKVQPSRGYWVLDIGGLAYIDLAKMQWVLSGWPVTATFYLGGNQAQRAYPLVEIFRYGKKVKSFTVFVTDVSSHPFSILSCKKHPPISWVHYNTYLIICNRWFLKNKKSGFISRIFVRDYLEFLFSMIS